MFVWVCGCAAKLLNSQRRVAADSRGYSRQSSATVRRRSLEGRGTSLYPLFFILHPSSLILNPPPFILRCSFYSDNLLNQTGFRTINITVHEYITVLSRTHKHTLAYKHTLSLASLARPGGDLSGLPACGSVRPEELPGGPRVPVSSGPMNP